MRNRQRQYLICYDIANQKRLQRVHRKVSNAAVAVQYSVFLATLSDSELDALLASLQQEIECSEDDIRAYPVDPAGAITLGSSSLPGDILLIPFPKWGMTRRKDAFPDDEDDDFD